MWLSVLLMIALAGADVDPALSEAVAHYQKSELEKATVVFQRATQDASLSTSARAQAHLWLGLCYGQFGDLEAARSSIKRALIDDATLTAPKDTPPALVKLLEEERAALTAPSDPAPTTATAPDDAPATTATAPSEAKPKPRPKVTEQKRAPDAQAGERRADISAGAVVAGVAACALMFASAASAAAGASQYSLANDLTVPAEPALRAYDNAITLGTVSVVLGAAGVAAGGVGIAVVMFGTDES